MTESIHRSQTSASPDVSLRLFGIAAAFGAAYLAGRYADRGPGRIDAKMRDAVLPISIDRVKTAATVITPPGFPLIYMPASLLVGMALSSRGNRGFASVPRAAMLAFVTYHAVKRLSSRRRPPSQTGERNYTHSFPSGHTSAATAVTVAAINAMRKNPDGAPTPALLSLIAGVPLLVGASRIVLDQHWFTDIVGGVAVGTAVAVAAAR
jgi:undecaprenyl-diphosphatase